MQNKHFFGYHISVIFILSLVTICQTFLWTEFPLFEIPLYNQYIYIFLYEADWKI